MNIKRKLGLGALVLGISGCCSGGRYDSAEFPEVPEVQNISTDVIASRPEERYVVNTSYSCVQADVIMGARGYHIECDGGRRLLFEHFCESGDYLRSGGNHYMDDNLDGRVDRLYVDGVEATVSDGLSDNYRVTLEKLGKDKVQKLWEERWRPNSCKTK